nr:hypothetical protein [Sphingomonas carotinifaciens]
MFGSGKRLDQHGTSRAQPLQLVDEQRRIYAFEDRGFCVRNLLVDLAEFCLVLGARADAGLLKPVGLCCIFLQKCRDHIVAQHGGGQAFQHPRVERILPDGQAIVAPGRALLCRALAAEAMLTGFGVARSAYAARHLPCQQVLRPLLSKIGAGRAGRFRTGGARKGCLPGLHGPPQGVWYDAKVGSSDKGRGGVSGVDEGVAFPGVRVLAVGLLSIRALPNVQLVVEDAGAAGGVAGQRVRRPGSKIDPTFARSSAARGGDALGIEAPGDGNRRQPGGIILVDPHHDGRLRGDDLLEAADPLAIAVIGHPGFIAIGRTPRIAAHRLTAHQRVTGLLARRAQLLGVDRPHHADVQRGHHAFLARCQDNAAEAQPLEQRGDIGLAARQPVHRIGVDDVDVACLDCRQQRLHTGTVQRRSRLRGVREARHFAPSLTLDLAPAHHQLRLDRQHVLLVRREARIYRAAHRFSSCDSHHASDVRSVLSDFLPAAHRSA